MKNSLTVILRFFLLFVAGVLLLDYSLGSGQSLLEKPIYMLVVLAYMLVLVIVEVLLYVVEKSLFNLLSPDAQERYLAHQKEHSWAAYFKKIIRKLTRSRDVEEEGLITLDHGFDGITELDNVLPPWWLYLFYATIFFGGVYMVRFHIYKDYTQIEEFEQEVALAQSAVEEYKRTAKDLVDENTVVLLEDAASLAAGKAIFEANCVACHMADGGGGIGPNLTDNYWILGGDIKSVFRTISEGGRDGKGMIAWKATLKPSEIAQVAAYALQFVGTTPANPKAPEGTPDSLQ